MKQPKKFVFVLMPFNNEFDDIYTYGVKQTCTNLDTYCERVDEQIYSERILDRIYNQISKADIIIADMTNRNANVFYEVGYAHGLGKNVILLTQKSEDIPFDLKHFPHIIYNRQIKFLSEQLKSRLEWFLNSETAEEVKNFDFGLEFLINGEKLTEDKILKVTEDLQDIWADHFNLKIDIFNSSSKVHKSKFKIGLETSIENKDYILGLKSLKPSKDKMLFTSKEITNIYPNAYKSIDFQIKKIIKRDGTPIKMDFVLKVFTSLELRTINFSLFVPVESHPFGQL